MRIALFAVLAVTSLLSAQESRREALTSPANPAQDTKPNSGAVPDAYVITGHIQRVVVLRCKFNTDLLAELEKTVKQEQIRNAVILNAAGSVRGYHVHQVGNRDFPVKNIYVKDPTASADIIGISGYVINGRLHPHITLSSPDKAFGGHLEPGTIVFTFAIVTLGVLEDGRDLTKIDDWTYR